MPTEGLILFHEYKKCRDICIYMGVGVGIYMCVCEIIYIYTYMIYIIYIMYTAYFLMLRIFQA